MTPAAQSSREIRTAIADTMRHIYRSGMTTMSGGNISVLDEGGCLWITPAGVDKDALAEEDIVAVSDGGAPDGPRRPSSELPFHQGIYQARRDVRTVIHAHPTALVAFSMCHEVPDTAVLVPAQARCGAVGYVNYELTGSDRLGQRIARAFADGHDCVILENHGVVVCGDNIRSALARFEMLELTARVIANARRLGGERLIAEHQWAERQRQVESPPRDTQRASKVAPTSPARAVCEITRRAAQRGLMTSADGDCSVRLTNSRFAMTRANVDRRRMRERDLIELDGASDTCGSECGALAPLHAAIYATHPHLNAVCTTTTSAATAFAIADAPLNSASIPESFIMLGKIVRIPLHPLVEDVGSVAAAVGPDRPVALLANHGVLAAGAGPLEALDRLEVLEATAETWLTAEMIGQPIPLGDQARAELISTFHLRPGAPDQTAIE